ncbi:MAG: hypothetical protein ABW023_08310 [Sphingomonas sp.]
MKKIAKAIAVPVERIVNPVELALGAAVIVAGLATLAGKLLPLG